MKHHRLICAICGLLAAGMVSCLSNVQVEKQQSEAYRNIGEAYIEQGDYTSALKQFLMAEKLYADDPFLQNNLGLAYLARGRVDLAIRHLKKAIDLNPDYAPARNNLGRAYVAKGDYDAAIPYFLALTENLIYATPHYPLSNLGWIYYNKKEYDRAEAYYKEALDVNPTFINALLGLGRTYLARGKISDSIQTLEKTADMYPQIPEIHLELARAYASLREYEKAREGYDRTMQLAPKTPIAEIAEQEARKIEALR